MIFILSLFFRIVVFFYFCFFKVDELWKLTLKISSRNFSLHTNGVLKTVKRIVVKGILWLVQIVDSALDRK